MAESEHYRIRFNNWPGKIVELHVSQEMDGAHVIARLRKLREDSQNNRLTNPDNAAKL